ncbi:hypothetical protein TSACC_3327 [Terrimicrobium sacchariphilum]|uniref:Uncharacterized protein n=1 Tax=Terrimicrobium sacchariphilum TaxID=690879 RepID=A0A146GDN8_TERSA|nr:hypothetical protein TSACC_3327 [Terrimicrobium sacchariphilum]
MFKNFKSAEIGFSLFLIRPQHEVSSPIRGLSLDFSDGCSPRIHQTLNQLALPFRLCFTKLRLRDYSLLYRSFLKFFAPCLSLRHWDVCKRRLPKHPLFTKKSGFPMRNVKQKHAHFPFLHSLVHCRARDGTIHTNSARRNSGPDELSEKIIPICNLLLRRTFASVNSSPFIRTADNRPEFLRYLS